MSSRWTQAAIVVGLTTLTLAVFAPVRHFDFINLDDESYITANPFVREGLSPATIRWAFTTFHGGYWMPITWLSFQLDATLFWPAPGAREGSSEAAWGFHLTNLAYHLLDVLLLYCVLARYTGALGRSAVVAALFAIHPLHVESVAWVTERKDVLSTFFLLLCLLAYHAYATKNCKLAYAGLVACFFLGLASKPMLVTLPCVLLLLDYWPLGRFAAGAKWRLLLEKLPLFALSLLFSVVTVFAQHDAGAVALLLSPAERVSTALYGYGWYLAKTFWPTKLGLLYPWESLPVLSAEALVPLVVLVLVSMFVVWRIRRQPALLVGWLWFLGTLLPVSGLLQSGDQAVADRFVYIPHIGLFTMLVWWAGDLATRLRSPRFIEAVASFAIVGVLTWITVQQVEYWQNTETIMSHSVLVIDKNHRAYECLGHEYLEQGNARGALNMAGQALRYGTNARYYVLQAKAHEKLGNIDEKYVALNKAAQLLRQQLDKQGFDAGVYTTMGQVLFQTGDDDLARDFLRRSLDHNDKQPVAHFVLGMVELRQGRSEASVASFDHALLQDPELHQAWDRKGMALARLGHWEEARDSFRRAMEMKPDDSYYRANLAFAAWNLGEKNMASEHYARVLQKDPDWPKKAAARALTLISHPTPGLRDLREASELAEEACQADAANADLARVRAEVAEARKALSPR